MIGGPRGKFGLPNLEAQGSDLGVGPRSGANFPMAGGPLWNGFVCNEGGGRLKSAINGGGTRGGVGVLKRCSKWSYDGGRENS